MTLVQTEPKKIYIGTGNTPRLPAEYQEVEYIESSGTQYLKPGVSHSAGDTIKFEADIFIKGNGCIYGQYTNYPPFNMFQVGIDNGNFFARMNANDNGTLPTTWTPSTYTVNTRYSVVAEGQTTINQKAPYLLAQNDTNGASWYLSAKLYSFKIYKNGTLQRELVPCYRKADTVIGLYDLVNDTFYTNSGTGTFTKGANIGGEQEIKKIVIFPDGVTEKQIRPTGWQPGANTIAYYPLKTDTNDYSGNNRHGTNNGVTFSDGVGVFNGSSYVSLGTGSWTNIQTNMTINVWFKWNGGGSYDNSVIGKSQYYMQNQSYGYYAIDIHEEDRYLCGGYCNGSDYNYHPMNFRNTGGGSPTTGPVVQANKWYNVVITNDGNTKKAYVDGVLYATENISSTTSSVSIDTRIGSFVRCNHDSFFNGNISAVIFEDKTWTDQEVSDYYNLTKGNYGL